MKFIFLMISLILISVAGHAGPQLGGYFEYRIEKASDGVVLDRYPLGFFVGYQFEKIGIVGERIFISSSTESSSTLVQKNHEEYNLWGHYRFPVNIRFLHYLGVGAGINRDYVRTQVLDADTESFGEWNGQLGVLYGAQLQLKPAFVAAEVRIQSIAGYSPNPLWTIGAKVGLEF